MLVTSFKSKDFSEALKRDGYDGIFKNGDVDLLDEKIAFSPSQIKSATDNTGNFDEISDDIRFQFIGEKGAANLDKAEEATTRMENLNVAREMEATPKDAKNIKLATGWERGADGKWRYEIPDIPLDIGALEQLSRNRLSYNFRKRISQPEYHAPLEDVITDKRLVNSLKKAYGRLPHFSFSMEVKADGVYDPLRNSIDLSTWVKGDRITGMLLHEIQHWIQHKEGFSVGGNVDTTGTYANLSGEVEARNVARRMRMMPEERRASLAAETEDVAREDQIFIYDALGGQASENSHISGSNFTPITRQEAKALAGLLKKTSLAKDVVFGQGVLAKVVKESNDTITLRTPVGEVYGAVKDGVVYLDDTMLNANTPIHEFGHLWNDIVRKDNPQLWAKIVELVKETPYFKDLANNPAYAHLKDDNARVNEAFAQALGDEGERIFHNNDIGNTLKERFHSLLREFWKWTGEKLGIRNLSPKQASKLTFEQVIRGAVADLTSGKVIEQKSVPTKIGKVVLSVEQREKLAKGDAITIIGLTDKSGKKHTSHIRWNCQNNKIEFINIKPIKQNKQNRVRSIKI